VDALVSAAADWVDDVHPHARHLHRTLEWLLKLDPQASVGLQIAALTHDIERAFPGEEAPPSYDDPASPEYNAWHQQRAAEMVGAWLERRDAPRELIDEVVALVRVHEQGGWPEADLLQAADSLSFLEVQTEFFAGRVARGQLSAQSAERKLQFMYERVRLPQARELAAPLMQTAAATLSAVVPDASAPEQSHRQPPSQQQEGRDACIRS
jgi:hypothetical protein